MKKERKGKSLNKAERMAKKGVITEILIAFGLITLMIFLVIHSILPVIELSFFDFLLPNLSLWIFMSILYVLAIVLYWFVRKKDYLNYAYRKLREEYSEKTVEEKLIPGKPTRIRVVGTRDNNYEDFILKDLPEQADFYAVLGEKDGLITVYVRFKGETQNRFFDVITKKEFLTYCEIIE